MHLIRRREGVYGLIGKCRYLDSSHRAEAGDASLNLNSSLKPSSHVPCSLSAINICGLRSLILHLIVSTTIMVRDPIRKSSYRKILMRRPANNSRHCNLDPSIEHLSISISTSDVHGSCNVLSHPVRFIICPGPAVNCCFFFFQRCSPNNSTSIPDRSPNFAQLAK